MKSNMRDGYLNVDEELDVSNPEHEDYNPFDTEDNAFDRWTDLERHLEKYAEQSDDIDLDLIPDILIPQKYGRYDSFSNEIEEEQEEILDNYLDEVESERENRVDLSDEEIGIACDPSDAKDHDDAYVVDRTDEGYNVRVHIADVTHFIDQDSAIYDEMVKRAVTFYLGENTRHMAPPDLVKDVFSLAPGEDRLAVTFDIDFDEDGTQTDFDIYKSIVRTENLDYPQTEELISSNTVDDIDPVYEDDEEMDNMLEAFKDDELEEMMANVKNASELTDTLRERRWDQSFILNEDTEASKIVQELMVNTNNGAGTFLKEEKGRGIYRQHEPPEDDFINNVRDILEDNDYEVNQLHGDIYEEPERVLNNFFHPTDKLERGVNAIRDDEEHRKELRSDIIQEMERAQFTASSRISEAIPHSGLGIHNYAQVTSPIRRLTDFGNHLIMKDMAIDDEELGHIAEITTQMEMLADEASRVYAKANT